MNATISSRTGPPLNVRIGRAVASTPEAEDHLADVERRYADVGEVASEQRIADQEPDQGVMEDALWSAPPRQEPDRAERGRSGDHGDRAMGSRLRRPARRRDKDRRAGDRLEARLIDVGKQTASESSRPRAQVRRAHPHPAGVRTTRSCARRPSSNDVRATKPNASRARLVSSARRGWPSGLVASQTDLALEAGQRGRSARPGRGS